jgi:hypothetical protein
MTQSVEIKSPDDTKAVAIVDGITPSLTVIDSVHQNTHAGILYTGCFAFATQTTVDLLIRTLADRPAHFAARASADVEFSLEFFEGPTSSADGTPVAAINRNRITANTAVTLVFEGPTVSVAGTSLGCGFVPGGSGGNAPGGQGSSFGEYILAPATDYLLRLTGASRSGTVSVDWYEPG